MSTDILPWHQEAWARVSEQISSERLPHAVLVSGPADSGKYLFTDALTRQLLCKKASACGECAQCHLLAAGTHPDLHNVGLEDSKQIRIEQIRDVINWVHQTPQQGGYKVCVISPADKLNVQSANALLKCLEEPPKNTLICLVTDKPMRLLPTLRSRCQRIDCRLPQRDEALSWLQQNTDTTIDVAVLLDIAGGVPLRVLNTIDDEFLTLRSQVAAQLGPLAVGDRSPIALAASFAKQDPLGVLDVLYQFVSDSIGFTLSEKQVVKSTDLIAELEVYSNAVGLDARYRFLDRITSAKASLLGTSNANAQMLLEWVFMDAV
jgi:DNA polymerase-3 subunit delta'